ncbi:MULTISPECIES: DUF3987 domain-containing protein [Actinosynnema]|uniref:DUF3987 domain-containing protein n=1 Tax=Actinosynnema TaxID=40566 RepID=UPI0020A5737D|nr:DUF3987 domain-containing protein [Actinosynnema pretiosum]MCP2093357.1 Protein of unknown function (DUF3987) [Actinosynnema pretiosum]
MTTPARPLRAVPDPSADLDAAEARARAEVDRARAELPQLDPAVFDCHLGEVVDQLSDSTEGDPVGILASLICAAGVHLGQRPHIRAGDDPHPLLVWPLIVGRTGGGRKGASWSTPKRLLAAADPGFTGSNIRSGLTSGEGLAAVFADQDADDQATGKPRKNTGTALLPPGDLRLMVFEPEWAGVMSRMKREGNALSATLRQAWEGGDLSTLNVTARIAPSSHVGLLAHITPDEFRAKVSSSDLAGGTYNRFLPIAVARSKFLPLAGGAAPELVSALGRALAARLKQGSQVGALGFTDKGALLWRSLYVEFGIDHGEGGPVEQFLSRTAPNCLRIAGVHAALDGTDLIDVHHLTAAAALVRYSVASARSIFSADPTLTRLTAWIGEAGTTGRTREEIRAQFFKGNKSAAEITTVLGQLIDSGQLARSTRPPAGGRGGRPTEVYATTGPPRG